MPARSRTGVLTGLSLAGLLVACSSGASPSATPAAETSPTAIPTATADVTPSPSPVVTPAPTPVATPTPTALSGWPTVSRAGVTITGHVAPECPLEDCHGAGGPSVVLEVTISGLKPGESVSLVGTGAYEFAGLACGLEPSPCLWGNQIDPPLPLCKPTYEQPAAGTATTAAQATAASDGTAAASLRFVASQSERPCPAGPSLPWWLRAGRWSSLQAIDEQHGLRLVTEYSPGGG